MHSRRNIVAKLASIAVAAPSVAHKVTTGFLSSLWLCGLGRGWLRFVPCRRRCRRLIVLAIVVVVVIRRGTVSCQQRTKVVILFGVDSTMNSIIGRLLLARKPFSSFGKPFANVVWMISHTDAESLDGTTGDSDRNGLEPISGEFAVDRLMVCLDHLG